MRVTIKFYASLAVYLPAIARATNQHHTDLPIGITVASALAPYGLPPELTKLVLVNGHYIGEEERPNRVLSEGDVLAVWPPIAGG